MRIALKDTIALAVVREERVALENTRFARVRPPRMPTLPVICAQALFWSAGGCIERTVAVRWLTDKHRPGTGSWRVYELRRVNGWYGSHHRSM